MDRTETTLKRYSRAEAIDILSQVKAVRMALDALEERAWDALRQPELRLVGKE